MKSPDSPIQQAEQPQKEPMSPEEIEAIKKEMFMTGGGVKIGQTMEEYRAAREELWAEKKRRETEETQHQSEAYETKKAGQVAVDQAAANQIRKKLGIAEQSVRPAMSVEHLQRKTETTTPKNSDMPEFEKCKDLPNIQQGLHALQKRLSMPDPEWKTVQNIIYDMLTTRSDFTKRMEENGGDLPKLLEGLEKERTEYNNLVKTTIPEWVDTSNEFKWESNPAWFGINTRPEVPKREDINIKTYATVPAGQYNFVQHIPLLAQELRKLALESDDIIQVKVPGNFATFISKNDSIVIHYKKAENSGRIQEILQQWMGQHNVAEEPREMERTKNAADSKGSSFTDLVAQNITDWLKGNHGKYDNSLLSKLAIEHAIRQSQEPPEIEKR